MEYTDIVEAAKGLPEESVAEVVDFIEFIKIKKGKPTQLSKEEKKKRFLESAGTISIDASAVAELRERSMI